MDSHLQASVVGTRRLEQLSAAVVIREEERNSSAAE